MDKKFDPTEGELSGALSDVLGAVKVFGAEDPRTEGLRSELRGLLREYAAAHSVPIFGVPRRCGLGEALRRAASHFRDPPPPEEVARLLGASAATAATAAVEAASAAKDAAGAAWADYSVWHQGREGARPLWEAFLSAARRHDEALRDLAEVLDA